MKRKYTKKIILTAILSWVFIHVIFLVIGIGQRDGHLFKYLNPYKVPGRGLTEEITKYRSINVVNDFYPFDYSTTILDYDISEFLIYAGIPLFVYFICIYVFRKDSVKS